MVEHFYPFPIWCCPTQIDFCSNKLKVLICLSLHFNCRNLTVLHRQSSWSTKSKSLSASSTPGIVIYSLGKTKVKRVLVLLSLTVTWEDKSHTTEDNASCGQCKEQLPLHRHRLPSFWIWEQGGGWSSLELKPLGTGSAICRSNPLGSVSFGCYVCLWTITPSSYSSPPHTHTYPFFCLLPLLSTCFPISSPCWASLHTFLSTVLFYRNRPLMRHPGVLQKVCIERWAEGGRHQDWVL